MPEGEADCDGARCLSDRQLGGLLKTFSDALDEANARIAGVKAWADRVE